MIVVNKKLEPKLDLAWHTLQEAIQLRNDFRGQSALPQAKLDEVSVDYFLNMVNAYHRAIIETRNDPRVS